MQNRSLNSNASAVKAEAMLMRVHKFNDLVVLKMHTVQLNNQQMASKSLHGNETIFASVARPSGLCKTCKPIEVFFKA